MTLLALVIAFLATKLHDILENISHIELNVAQYQLMDHNVRRIPMRGKHTHSKGLVSWWPANTLTRTND